MVTYALAIYQLNLFVLFLTPKGEYGLLINPSGDDDVGGASLPDRQDDEFRPFMRQLGEYRFW